MCLKKFPDARRLVENLLFKPLAQKVFSDWGTPLNKCSLFVTVVALSAGHIRRDSIDIPFFDQIFIAINGKVNIGFP